MYYLTNVILSQDLNPCIKKNGKWIPTYRWRRDIGLHFGFRDPTYIGRVTSDDADSRQVRKIVVHPGYDIKGIFILLSSIEAIRKTFFYLQIETFPMTLLWSNSNHLIIRSGARKTKMTRGLR